MSALREEDVEAVLEALRSGWLTMGPRIAAFEAQFADWTGAGHAVAVSSGTAALHLACLAVGVGPGDRVLVPAFGSPAAAAAVRHCGGEPVFCDVVSAAVPVIDVVEVERRLEGARAVVVEHLWGHAADVVELLELCEPRGIAVIEDCRDALGAVTGRRQVGTIGHAGCFSFADGRVLPVGEGGMVTTAADELAGRVRLLRAHAMTSGTWDRHRGHSDTYDVVDVGFNFRLDEPRAALGSSRLRHLREDIEARRAVLREWRARETLCFGAEDDAWASPGCIPLLDAERPGAVARPALAPLPHALEAAERTRALAL
jgi:dTDP-4-amino-4,6-dideoxygalactose transaminase